MPCGLVGMEVPFTLICKFPRSRFVNRNPAFHIVFFESLHLLLGVFMPFALGSRIQHMWQIVYIIYILTCQCPKLFTKAEVSFTESFIIWSIHITLLVLRLKELQNLV